MAFHYNNYHNLFIYFPIFGHFDFFSFYFFLNKVLIIFRAYVYLYVSFFRKMLRSRITVFNCIIWFSLYELDCIVCVCVLITYSSLSSSVFLDFLAPCLEAQANSVFSLGSCGLRSWVMYLQLPCVLNVVLLGISWFPV